MTSKPFSRIVRGTSGSAAMDYSASTTGVLRVSTVPETSGNQLHLPALHIRSDGKTSYRRSTKTGTANWWWEPGKGWPSLKAISSSRLGQWRRYGTEWTPFFVTAPGTCGLVVSGDSIAYIPARQLFWAPKT